MARKQSLANKRRSQKRRNKKRARTIRSMRQVNEGGGFMDRLRRRLGLGKSSNLPSELYTSLLQGTEQQVDDSGYEQNFQPESLMAPPVSPVSSVLSSDQKKETQAFSAITFDQDLRTLLLSHVASHFAFPTEQNLEVINAFIFNPDNRDIVLSPLIEYIKDRLEINTKFTLTSTLDDNTIVLIDTHLNELSNYAKKFYNKFYNKFDVNKLFYSIQMQLILYVYENEYLLSELVDKMKPAVTIGTLTFLNIFNDSNVVPNYDTIQESTFLREHVLAIKHHINLTADGSKGKMPRPKSRTRKS